MKEEQQNSGIFIVHTVAVIRTEWLVRRRDVLIYR